MRVVARSRQRLGQEADLDRSQLVQRGGRHDLGAEHHHDVRVDAIQPTEQVRRIRTGTELHERRLDDGRGRELRAHLEVRALADEGDAQRRAGCREAGIHRWTQH